MNTYAAFKPEPLLGFMSSLRMQNNALSPRPLRSDFRSGHLEGLLYGLLCEACFYKGAFVIGIRLGVVKTPI